MAMLLSETVRGKKSDLIRCLHAHRCESAAGYSTVQLLGPLIKSLTLLVRSMREGWCP